MQSSPVLTLESQAVKWRRCWSRLNAWRKIVSLRKRTRSRKYSMFAGRQWHDARLQRATFLRNIQPPIMMRRRLRCFGSLYAGDTDISTAVSPGAVARRRPPQRRLPKARRFPPFGAGRRSSSASPERRSSQIQSSWLEPRSTRLQSRPHQHPRWSSLSTHWTRMTLPCSEAVRTIHMRCRRIVDCTRCTPCSW